MTADYTPLWYWVRTREAIRIEKARRGALPVTAPAHLDPLTDDPILATYRFCNVRREDDRVTVWIRKNIRERFAHNPMLWLYLCIARQINWPDTLAELIASGNAAWPGIGAFAPELMAGILNARAARGEKVYTGAYMIPAPADKGADKQRHIAEKVIGDLYRRRTLGGWPPTSLQGMHQWIMRTPGWGNFLAYQAVVDMRFTRILESAPDVATWAAAGPGTIRGLNRIHQRPLTYGLSQERALGEMRAIYKIATAETGVALDFSDVPNILCETDKYLRVKLGEGKPRALYVAGRGA